MNEVDKLAKCIRECLDIVEITYGERTIPIHPIPESEPCKHEPMSKMRGLMEILEMPADAPMEFQCKHCSKIIKAMGWELV